MKTGVPKGSIRNPLLFLNFVIPNAEIVYSDGT